jgi:putative PIN family toxin of toxin-antitoxin system
VSPQIRAEVEETLGRKFRWNQEKVNNACMPLWHHAEEVQPTLVLDVTADPDDNRILECAVAGVAQAIVTGDDDLLRLKKFEGVEIIKPRVFLNRFE